MMKKIFCSGLAILSFGVVTVPMAGRAMDSGMPSGYTLSKTPIPGQHCYYHGGGHVNYYCYSHKLDGSMMNHNMGMNNGSMSKPSGMNNGSMNKPSGMNNGSMNKPSGMNNGSMMKH